MIVIGVDVGLGGAIAILESRSGYNCPVNLIEPVGLYDMPIKRDPISDGKVVDSVALQKIFALYKADLVMVERVWQLPKQSAQSGFTFGRTFQAVITIADLAMFHVEQCTPQKWQSRFGIKGKKKAGLQSVDVAEKLFPTAKTRGSMGGIKDGRCDAILIAYYGLQNFR